MKIRCKILFCMLCIIASNTAISQYTLIPDIEFEMRLVDQGIDTEGIVDGQVLTDDIDQIITLDLFDVTGGPIADLTGIEDFTSLEGLYFADNQVETVDLSNNLNLKHLNCKFNNLTSLDLTNNILLETLDAANCFPGTCNQENTYTTLDLSNNTSLEFLFIVYVNTLSSLNLSNNTSLITVGVSSNSILNSLNLKNGNNTNLVNLSILENSILTCVEVDDPLAATNGTMPPYDMWNVDPNIIFSENCILGSEDFKKPTVSVLPNPVKNVLTIESANSIVRKVTVLDVLGKEIVTFFKNFEELHIDNLETGVYLVRIYTTNGITTQRIIKN